MVGGNHGPGRVIWITGLSGAGKTSIAKEVVEQLRNRDRAILLDGDAVREVVADPSTGHDVDSRLVNAYRICRLAKMLANQGFSVVVATMSLFREVHAWNRANLPSYFEVYLRVDLKVLRARDPKGLYARSVRGDEADLVGVNIAGEEPLAPNLVIDNNGVAADIPDVAAHILSRLPAKGGLRRAG